MRFDCTVKKYMIRSNHKNYQGDNNGKGKDKNSKAAKVY